MSEELKLCPYCKGNQLYISKEHFAYTVNCSCGMTGPIMGTSQEAAEAWNALPRRSDIEQGADMNQAVDRYIFGDHLFVNFDNGEKRGRYQGVFLQYNPYRRTNAYIAIMFNNGSTEKCDIHLSTIQRGDW